MDGGNINAWFGGVIVLVQGAEYVRVAVA